MRLDGVHACMDSIGVPPPSTLTKLGAAHPSAADSTVITASALIAAANTVMRGFLIAMICMQAGESQAR